MILIIYACHSCYIRFCRNRRDNAGAILNLPNMVQLPSKFPIGSPFLHEDDGITRGVARIFQRGGHRRYSPDYIWFIPLLSLVYQRAQSYYRGMKAHINWRQEPLTKILYKKTNFKKVGFSTMAFTAKILFRHLNIVGCLLKRRPTKGGGHGHPRTPLPSYAPVLL